MASSMCSSAVKSVNTSSISSSVGKKAFQQSQAAVGKEVIMENSMVAFPLTSDVLKIEIQKTGVMEEILVVTIIKVSC